MYHLVTLKVAIQHTQALKGSKLFYRKKPIYNTYILK